MSDMLNLLIVDDDETLVRVFEKVARDNGWKYAVATNGEQALSLLNRHMFEAAVVDVMLPGFSGLQLLEHVKKSQLSTEVVIITGVGSVEAAVSAIKQGAYDYLTKPFPDIEKVAHLLNKAMERFRMVQELRLLEHQGEQRHVYEEIVGQSKKMHDMFSLIESVAPSSSTVIITGESGTGKELVAKAIHRRSKRAKKPMVVINCAAIPHHLLESELFGHKKGSFTGAIADRKGLFEEADQGSVFLDEVGELPPALQVKLLRVLQEGEVKPVGATATMKVDVRLIAATNRDLVNEVKNGNFREDLFYRLNVITINLPSLRERPEDIPLLAYHFLEKYSKKLGKNVDRIAVDAMHALQHYRWIGNVRELENAIERAVVLCERSVISVRDLPPRILGEICYVSDEKDEAGVDDITELPYREAKEKIVESFNKRYFSKLLETSGGNVSFAAEKAGMDRSNFKKLIKKTGISVTEFRATRN